MRIILKSKRQVTLPAEVCELMQIKLGAKLEIAPGNQPDEWSIQPFRIHQERLAPLQGKLKKGMGSFDLQAFRDLPKDNASLRD